MKSLLLLVMGTQGRIMAKNDNDFDSQISEIEKNIEEIRRFL